MPVIVLILARSAADTFDFLLNHGDDRVIGHKMASAAKVIYDIAEPD